LTQHETRYQRNPDFIYRKIVDETILVPIHKDVANMDSIYTLNTVGAFIWQQLDQHASRAELEAAVLETFDVDPQILTEDMDRFLNEMVAFGALREA